jgi:hypothetical protein
MRGFDSLGKVDFPVGHRCSFTGTGISVGITDSQVIDNTSNGGEGGIRITLKSLEGLHRFFKDFRTDTRFSDQNRIFLITRSCSFHVAFCSLPPNKVIARFPGHAVSDFAEPWVAYPDHGKGRSREREQSRCRNDAKMPLAA